MSGVTYKTYKSNYTNLYVAQMCQNTVHYTAHRTTEICVCLRVDVYIIQHTCIRWPACHGLRGILYSTHV